jgi:hypothetical protein
MSFEKLSHLLRGGRQGDMGKQDIIRALQGTAKLKSIVKLILILQLVYPLLRGRDPFESLLQLFRVPSTPKF